jgi:hypothetical protein
MDKVSLSAARYGKTETRMPDQCLYVRGGAWEGGDYTLLKTCYRLREKDPLVWITG